MYVRNATSQHTHTPSRQPTIRNRFISKRPPRNIRRYRHRSHSQRLRIRYRQPKCPTFEQQSRRRPQKIHRRIRKTPRRTQHLRTITQTEHNDKGRINRASIRTKPHRSNQSRSHERRRKEIVQSQKIRMVTKIEKEHNNGIFVETGIVNEPEWTEQKQHSQKTSSSRQRPQHSSEKTHDQSMLESITRSTERTKGEQKESRNIAATISRRRPNRTIQRPKSKNRPANNSANSTS